MRLAPAVAVAVALVAGALSEAHRAGVAPGPWSRAELAWLDLGLGARGGRPAGPDVVLVWVDDASVQRDPTLTERRAGAARLVRALHDAGAAVVALDLFMAEPERLLPEDLTSELQSWAREPEPATPPRAAELLERVRRETEGDAALAAALAESRAVIAMHLGGRGGVDPADRSLTRGTWGQAVPGPDLPELAGQVLVSHAQLAESAARMGFVTVREDELGVVRKVPLAMRVGPRHFVPFGLQLLAAKDEVPRARMAYVGPERAVTLGDRRIEGSGPGELWLNWRSPGTFEEVSAIELFEPGFDRARVAGRVALVGYSFLSQDTARSPFGVVQGAEIHATVADNALAGDFLRPLPAGAAGGLALLVGLGVAAGFAAPGGRAGPRILAALGAVALAIGAPGWLLAGDRVLFGLGPCVAALGGGVGAALTAWVQEGAQARALRKAFAHYVSDELLAEMAANPAAVQLGGQRREVTVLFSDIRDFTSFSERLTPLELVSFLNHYLTPMTRAVLGERGFVDKFIGDAVMALFGAPVPDPNHAASACRAALAMWAALDAVRPEAEKHGIALAIGVGVNTGEVAVGNMGSDERFEYTAMGDAVNLASRLEGLTKGYGVFCLVGPATARALPAGFVLRPVDLVRVKGKSEPVEIFELCGDVRVEVAAYAARPDWDAALAAWRRGDLGAARESFARFRAVNPSDPVVALYLERLAALGDAAPPDWDGVFTHTRK